MMKRDIKKVIRLSAVAGKVGTKLSVYPDEVKTLINKGFTVSTSKRGTHVPSEKVEALISWENAKCGTPARKYWKLVQKHRRENAKYSRKLLRKVDKRAVVDLLNSILPEDVEEGEFFNDGEYDSE